MRPASLAAAVCGLAVLIAVHYLSLMTSPLSMLPPFSDANTYLAAGERLNAGHGLYALAPGDRAVTIDRSVSSAPLLSPPPIAVLWRPIAAVPFGFALWVAACWACLLGTLFVLVYRSGYPGAILGTLLAPAVGEQLAAGNAIAFFPLLLVLAWRLRDRRVAGVIVAALTSVKLAPVCFVAWLLGGRRRVPASFLVAGVVILLISVIGAGLDTWSAYIGVVRSTGPSPWSLSGLTGLPWLSFAMLAGGTVAAWLLRARRGRSFAVAVATSVLGTPAVGLSTLATLIAVLVPVAWPEETKRRPVPEPRADP
jgi:hypothetical protein